jgi:hypothetical protein
MAKIVKTGAGVVRRSPEADQSGQLPENPMNVLDQQAATVLGDEEIRAASPVGLFVPARRIPQQHLPGRGMHRHEARLAELRVADDEDALPQIDVIPAHPEGFADAQPGHGEKPEQAMEGPSAQSVDGRQVQRRGQQPLDLLIGVEVRLGAPNWRKGPDRRHLRARFDIHQMAGKSTDVTQAQRPRTVATGRQCRPLERQLVGDDGGAVVLHERDEIGQPSFLGSELVPQAAAHGDVSVKGGSETTHGTPPGQAALIPRRLSTSTFA